MTLLELKKYMESEIDCGSGVTCGWYGGDQEKCIGIYYARPPDRENRLCLGGEEATSYQASAVKLLVHWTKSADAALEAASAIWKHFRSLCGVQIGNEWLISADPGAGPVSVARDERGYFEYVINITFRTKKGE